MKKPYWILLAVVLVVAVGLSLVSTRPGGAPQAEQAEAERTVTQLALVIEDGALAPARTAVPKGNEVHLRVANHDSHEVRLELAGYEDHVSLVLEAGATWEGTFAADRPGEDFVWLMDGAPAGRFDVLGSHLVEGHR